MEIAIDGTTTSILDGTLAIFVTTSGKVLLMGKVVGDHYEDLTAQTPGTFDPMKDEHSEVELTVANVPPSSGRLTVQDFSSVRICRNQSGNIVHCPPR